MTSKLAILVLLCAAHVSCENSSSNQPEPASGQVDELFRVGSVVVTAQDLEQRIHESHGGNDNEETRQHALSELGKRAHFVQAALDAGLADDPVIRQEIGRLLEKRLREVELEPKLKALENIPESRLRELYAAGSDRFQAPEKRQVAVLWLDPGQDPERSEKYTQKLQQARKFALQNKDIAGHPDKGFSVLAVDYSEHAASRFRGGVIGWLQRDGAGSDAWTMAVTEIAHKLKAGEISEVINTPEGIFLVRLMTMRPAETRSFDSVVADLRRTELTRLRRQLKEQFEASIVARHSVERRSARP